MKIKFKNKRLYPNLFLGLVWIGLSFLGLLEDDNLRGSDYLSLIIGILYIGHFLYDVTNQYLTIENGTIWNNRLYGLKKKINLNDINRIKTFAGDYILKTESKELQINTKWIEDKSLTELNKVLEKLNLPSDKTPFVKNE